MNITATDGITGENVTALTYHGFVNLKAKPGQDIMATMTPEKCHILHMAVGVAGEAAELFDADSVANTIEECGDIEFFLQGMTLNGSGIGYKEYHESPRATRTPVPVCQEHIVTHAGYLLDVIKKWAVYNKPLDVEKANEHWHAVHSHLDNMYVTLRTNRHEIIAANVDKLNKRYAAGYSDKEAQARADKKDGE